MRLDRYTTGSYTPGVAIWKQMLWYYAGQPLVCSSFLPFSGLKVRVLRAFGAQIGTGVRIKPGVRVKFPWRLQIGNWVWLGEEAWLDNLAPIEIGNHVCISQDVYLCTGNHDWTAPDFDLNVASIRIEDECWIAARAVIGPGVTVGRGAILGLGSVTGRSLDPMTVYVGNPARAIKPRQVRSSSDEPAVNHTLKDDCSRIVAPDIEEDATSSTD
ncbi:MAG: WcaF family extracellular polysaccharide biosynthesis acetyltransferase [Cyanobacteria bacterium P01_F01_bin.33]